MDHKPLSWFSRTSASDIYSDLRTTDKGLAQDDAQKRLDTLGKNTLAEEVERNWVWEILKNFKSPLVILLMVAALVSFTTGGLVDGMIIITMILLSVIMDFYQERKADAAAKKLQDSVITTVKVFRSGEQKEIPMSELAVGDVIVLEAGDLIPADCRFIQTENLYTNQATLTGESFPVEKSSNQTNLVSYSLEDMKNIGFAGTSVVSGSGKAIIVKTGANTEIGKIAFELAKRQTGDDDFERGTYQFGMLVVKLTIVLAVFIFFVNSLLKGNVVEALLFSLAVAVGLIPELLPVIMSVTMAHGSTKMAKKGVIVKKLSAIPSYGSMDILCTDKTGTLTEDKIKLVKYIDIKGNVNENVLEFAYLNSFFQTSIKNPMDEAVIALNRKSDDYTKITELPFDFERKRASVVVEKERKRYITCKGAPEEMLRISKSYQFDGRTFVFDSKAKKKAIAYYEELSKQGYRVLGVSTSDINKKDKYTKDDETDLQFLGFIAFLDPPKAEATQIIRELEKMGINIKVVTGDNEQVTEKICSEVGLPFKKHLLGKEISLLSDSELARVVESVQIFARCTPSQKSRIIKALQANNKVVGFLGDGINDSPALEAADVGISVDNGADIAKESADIILTHKSLEELKDGVFEGRKTFVNTTKYIKMGISSNFGNMFSLAIAAIFLPFLPMLPTQILLNNLLYDFAQITLPTDKVDEQDISKPRHWDMKFIKKFMFFFGPISSIYDLTTYFFLYYVLHVNAAMFQTGWFMESLATQTLVIFTIRTQGLPFIQSKPSKSLFVSVLLLVAIGWAIPYTYLGRLFGFETPPLSMALMLGGIVVAYLLTVEVAKHFFYSRLRRKMTSETKLAVA